MHLVLRLWVPCELGSVARVSPIRRVKEQNLEAQQLHFLASGTICLSVEMLLTLHFISTSWVPSSGLFLFSLLRFSVLKSRETRDSCWGPRLGTFPEMLLKSRNPARRPWVPWYSWPRGYPHTVSSLWTPPEWHGGGGRADGCVHGGCQRLDFSGLWGGALRILIFLEF